MKLSITTLRAVFYRIYNPNSNLNPKKPTLFSKWRGTKIGNIEN